MARDPLTPAALLTTVVVLTAAACSVPAPAAGGAAPPTRPIAAVTTAGPAPVATPAAAATGTPDLGASAPDATPTGNSWEPAVLDRVPDPPRLLALPADFLSPRAVAEAYPRAGYAPADQPANTAITNSAPWLTAAGWADDAARSVDEPTRARTRAAGVSTICGPAPAGISPQAPNTPDATRVGVTAQQARVAGGAVIGQGPVSMVRRILRRTAGGWSTCG